MFFLLKSVEGCPNMIVLEGEQILSDIQKLNKNPPNSLRELIYSLDDELFQSELWNNWNKVSIISSSPIWKRFYSDLRPSFARCNQNAFTHAQKRQGAQSCHSKAIKLRRIWNQSTRGEKRQYEIVEYEEWKKKWFPWDLKSNFIHFYTITPSVVFYLNSCLPCLFSIEKWFDYVSFHIFSIIKSIFLYFVSIESCTSCVLAIKLNGYFQYITKIIRSENGLYKWIILIFWTKDVI